MFLVAPVILLILLVAFLVSVITPGLHISSGNLGFGSADSYRIQRLGFHVLILIEPISLIVLQHLLKISGEERFQLVIVDLDVDGIVGD